MQIGKKKITLKMSAAYVAKLALLTALSFALYMAKFNLPFMFPSFLEMQFSELPALLAGFSMGPVAGALVIVLKCLFKLPLTSTAFVGELTDMLLGLVFVLPAAIFYAVKKDRKHAFWGLVTGTVLATAAAVIVNRYISIPFYTELYFNGDFDSLVGMCAVIYPNATADTFYAFYLGLGIVPFNLLRYIIIALLAFLLYKRLSRILHWEGTSLRFRLSGEYESASEEETFALAKKVADTLTGGETVLLDGDLGAGKTVHERACRGARRERRGHESDFHDYERIRRRQASFVPYGYVPPGIGGGERGARTHGHRAGKCGESHRVEQVHRLDRAHYKCQNNP